MKKLLRTDTYEQDAILCMSNIRGKYVKNPGKLPFSFYFSANADAGHTIRVKPVFNPDRMKFSATGTLKLCDDWEFVPGKDDKHVDSKAVQEMKNFFRRYLVLFCAVWDEQIDDGTVEDYFVGTIDFDDMVKQFDFYDEYSDDLDKIHTVENLESFCRDKNIVNFYGN